MPWTATSPSITVVVATRSREELLTNAVSSILAQDYTGDIEVICVYDQSTPNRGHVIDEPHRLVRVLRNTRRVGLAGARNTGILAATGDLIAFCDDDDTWRINKLTEQVSLMRRLDAAASVTGVAVTYDGVVRLRVPEMDFITAQQLSRSRLTGAHPSSFVMARELIDEIGLIDEDIPGSYGEDYDWLLRLSTAGRTVVVRRPLVDVLWHRGSYFSSRWQTIVDALEYLVNKHPSIAADRSGRARIQGQQAFALAALGQRAPALKMAAKAARSDPREQRAYFAVLVAVGAMSADFVVHQANKRGRGI
jgi:GT2 family glycosyltransferase